MRDDLLETSVRWSRTTSVEALLDVLTPSERQRVATVRSPQARDSIASSLVLARTAVGSWAGVDPATVELHRRCPRCGSRTHGRPGALRHAVHLSLSRTPGAVVVATTTAGEVGVDVERVRDHMFEGFDEVVLGPDEPGPVDDAARLRTWVRKEAVLKAAGRGLDIDPRTLALGPGDARPPLDGPWHLQDLDPADGFVGALAVRAQGPLTVRVTQVHLAGRD